MEQNAKQLLKRISDKIGSLTDKEISRVSHAPQEKEWRAYIAQKAPHWEDIAWRVKEPNSKGEAEIHLGFYTANPSEALNNAVEKVEALSKGKVNHVVKNENGIRLVWKENLNDSTALDKLYLNLEGLLNDFLVIAFDVLITSEKEASKSLISNQDIKKEDWTIVNDIAVLFVYIGNLATNGAQDKEWKSISTSTSFWAQHFNGDDFLKEFTKTENLEIFFDDIYNKLYLSEDNENVDPILQVNKSFFNILSQLNLGGLNCFEIENIFDNMISIASQSEINENQSSVLFSLSQHLSDTCNNFQNVLFKLNLLTNKTFQKDDNSVFSLKINIEGNLNQIFLCSINDDDDFESVENHYENVISSSFKIDIDNLISIYLDDNLFFKGSLESLGLHPENLIKIAEWNDDIRDKVFSEISGFGDEGKKAMVSYVEDPEEELDLEVSKDGILVFNCSIDRNTVDLVPEENKKYSFIEYGIFKLTTESIPLNSFNLKDLIFLRDYNMNDFLSSAVDIPYCFSLIIHQKVGIIDFSIEENRIKDTDFVDGWIFDA